MSLRTGFLGYFGLGNLETSPRRSIIFLIRQTQQGVWGVPHNLL